MITDEKTNTIYLSALTKSDFPEMSDELVALFQKHNIQYDFLKGTRDHYCRDYMPVQVNKEKFVQFVFRPTTYFKPNEYRYISNPVSIELENNLIQPVYSRLILDGGNVVRGRNKVIITDRVCDDNRFQMSESQILRELETLLEAEIIIVPALKKDKTGHADGMIRFIDANTVLINNLGFEEEKYWEQRFLGMLDRHGLQYYELPVFEDKPGSGVGIYINYLHVGKLIVVPFFDHPEESNEDVLKLMKKHFPQCTVTSVDATELAEHGGVLNCASWNILN